MFLPDPDRDFVHRVIGFGGAYISPTDRVIALLLRPVSLRERKEGTENAALVLPVGETVEAAQSPVILRLGNGFHSAPHEARSRPTSDRLQAFLDRLAQTTPGKLDVCLLVDGLRSTSVEPSPAVVALNRRLEAHFAPTHVAWLNAVAHFADQLQEVRTHPEAALSLDAFNGAVMAHEAAGAGQGEVFEWTYGSRSDPGRDSGRLKGPA